MAVNFVATVCGDMFGSVRAWLAAAVVIFVWGVTFANTRALLADFSALEIFAVRLVLAWGALRGWEIIDWGTVPVSVTTRRGMTAAG